MKFFEKFPLIWHTLEDNEQVLLQNITRRVMVVDKIKNIEDLLLEYDVTDGETPRQFAQRVYGSFELFWVVLLINRITDPVKQWPVPDQRITDYLIDRYGEEGMWETKHYVNEYGVETDIEAMRIAFGLEGQTDDTVIANYGLQPVTFHDDMVNQNEKKKNLKILHPDYITQFVAQFERELVNG